MKGEASNSKRTTTGTTTIANKMPSGRLLIRPRGQSRPLAVATVVWFMRRDCPQLQTSATGRFKTDRFPPYGCLSRLSTEPFYKRNPSFFRPRPSFAGRSIRTVECYAASLGPGEAPATSEMASDRGEVAVPTVDDEPSVERFSGNNGLIVASEMASGMDAGLSRDSITKRVEPDIGSHVTAKGRVGRDPHARVRPKSFRTSTAR